MTIQEMKKIEIQEIQKNEVRKNVTEKKAAILAIAKSQIEEKDVVAKVITKKKEVEKDVEKKEVTAKKDVKKSSVKTAKKSSVKKDAKGYSPDIALPGNLNSQTTKKECRRLYTFLKLSGKVKEMKKEVKVTLPVNMKDREINIPGNMKIENNSFVEALGIELTGIKVSGGLLTASYKKEEGYKLPSSKPILKEFLNRLTAGMAGRILFTGKNYGCRTKRKGVAIYLFDALDKKFSGFIPFSSELEKFVKSI